MKALLLAILYLFTVSSSSFADCGEGDTNEGVSSYQEAVNHQKQVELEADMIAAAERQGIDLSKPYQFDFPLNKRGFISTLRAYLITETQACRLIPDYRRKLDFDAWGFMGSERNPKGDTLNCHLRPKD